MSVFARFPPRLQEAIVSRLGWGSLRPVQEDAGEALLDGHNAVILAPTAGGKTEASVFPTLALLMEEQLQGVGALYVAPIKALLNNQRDRLGLYTEMVGMSRMVWHGDVSDSKRKKFLKEPTDFLMTTPESLEVMLMSTRVNEREVFGNLRVVIVDEVHAMAGTDRGAHLMSVLERLVSVSRFDVQRVGLSATVGNPEEILRWISGTSKRPGKVVDPPSAPAPRKLLIVYKEDPGMLASDASKLSRGAKSLFFCQTRATTENIAQKMRSAGTEVFVHHGSVSKEERQLAEASFHSGDAACIICTSTLELGIDVGDLDYVFQSNAPTSVSSFKQRMGRTGRRPGKDANTTFFCDAEESVLQATALIELTREKWVESVNVKDRVWPVLIHQLLAMSLAKGGIGREKAWAHLSTVPDFKGIHRGEFERLVDWLIRDGAFIETSGFLVIGPKAEHRFGRKNFMELYAVFSTPEFYTVAQNTGPPLGFLDQDFVDMLSDGISSFLLAGKAWFVQEVRHTDKRVIVGPAPRGREPKWGGFSAQFLSFELCQKMKAILQSEEDFKYLDNEARLALRRQRELMANVWEPEFGGVIYGDREIIWWTYAGGRINSTLRRALHAFNPSWEIVEGNYNVSIRGVDAEPHRFQEGLRALKEFEFWENERLWAEIAESLPGYRLSKFQPLMPPWVEREVLASHF